MRALKNVSACGLVLAAVAIYVLLLLTAIVYHARKPSLGALAVAIISAVFLEMVRPAGWLPLGAAAGYGFAAYRFGAPERRRAASTMLLAQCAVVLAALAFNAAMHGPSPAEHLRWEYPAAAPLLGVACAAPLAFLFNPADFRRALELPLIPVVAFGVVACVAAAGPRPSAEGAALKRTSPA